MKQWLLYSIITLVLWGVWGFLGKTSSQHIPHKVLVVLGSLGFAVSFVFVFAAFPRSMQFNFKNFHYYGALLSGIIAGVGVLFFYSALNEGDASRVVAFTAMYPLITVILSFLFLNEGITVYKIIGITCAITAAIFLSI